MERALIRELEKWKVSSRRKPLIIRGARQVGKTWLMQEFGSRFFENTVYINFDRDRRFHDLLEETLDPGKLLAAFGAVTGKKIHADSTLIILDEIQEEPRALSALKYFCEEKPEYAIVAAGSLLGVAMHEGTSFPVGKVDFVDLYPLHFREFLLAIGKESLYELLEAKDLSLITGLKGEYVEALRLYYYIGGMPEAVKTYISTNDFFAVRKVQEQLLLYYRQDFSKHAPATQIPRLNQVWDSIPSQLAKENRKFIYGQIHKGARAKDFELALQWLEDSGLLHMVHRVTKPGIPLKSYAEMSAFKVFLHDIGLLGALGGLPVEAVIGGHRMFEEFKGALTEQYVLQQLKADLHIHPYYYSAENSRGELDFLIQGSDNLCPIEVKAEENLQAKSLRAFVEKYKVPLGVRLSMSGFRRQDWLVNIPLYAFTALWDLALQGQIQ